jgi:thioredoxin reductase
MDFWLTQMPVGMALKSEGFASNLYDPDNRVTLKRFCDERGIDYADIGLPVLLSTFTAYGLAFKEEMVPNLEEKMVAAIARQPRGFALTLDDGEIVIAQQVVLAVGITHFAHIPPPLTGLTNRFLTHSSQHHNLRRFKGKHIAVIGGGASAIDLATLLNDAGAFVQLIARTKVLDFHERPSVKEFSNSTWHQIIEPSSGIGPGWRQKVYGDAPWLFHFLPREIRHRVVQTNLGPAGGWFSKDKLEGRLPLLLGCKLKQAEIRDGRVYLELATLENTKREVEVEHVIAATGYKVDLSRLSFLGSEIQRQLKVVENAPVLSSELQSSIPGLYFAGAATANSFGPVMRFAFGAGFTARRLAQVIAKHS